MSNLATIEIERNRRGMWRAITRDDAGEFVTICPWRQDDHKALRDGRKAAPAARVLT